MDDNEIASFDAAIARHSAEREDAKAGLVSLSERVKRALVDDPTFAAARRLEEHERVLELTIKRVDIVLPRLAEMRRQAVAVRRQTLIAEHTEKAAAAFDDLAAAMEAALAANERAAKVFKQALDDLGTDAGGVPCVAHTRLARQAVNFWRAANEEALGRRAPLAKPAAADSVGVKVLVPFVQTRGAGLAATYVAGDTISLPQSEAQRLAAGREVAFLRPEDAARLAPDPRNAPAPAARDGLLAVLFCRDGRGPDGASFACGDVAVFAEGDALRLVRDGRAEFVDLGPQDCAPIPKKEIVHVADRQ